MILDRANDPRDRLACHVDEFLDALDRGILGPPGGIDHRDTVESVTLQNLRASLQAVKSSGLSSSPSRNRAA